MRWGEGKPSPHYAFTAFSDHPNLRRTVFGSFTPTAGRSSVGLFLKSKFTVWGDTCEVWDRVPVAGRCELLIGGEIKGLGRRAYEMR